MKTSQSRDEVENVPNKDEPPIVEEACQAFNLQLNTEPSEKIDLELSKQAIKANSEIDDESNLLLS